ncbi:hypothetical protein OU664_27510, partial [Escherichia coli]|nr:hypothetical protein [Escherichia coli]MDF8952692.1 hypothetical protein [Escherichia coli]
PVLVFNSYIQHFLLPFITEVNFVDAVPGASRVPPGDVNQLTINAGYRESTHNTVFGFNCSTCDQPHSPHHKIHFKKGGRAVTE